MAERLQLFSFSGKYRILHTTWLAFFISFMVWFNHAPLMVILRDVFSMSDQEVKVLLLLNVALTIPARIIVGMLVDNYGPRRMFSGILVASGFMCAFFAMAQTFQQLALARFLLGFVGAGFVVGKSAFEVGGNHAEMFSEGLGKLRQAAVPHAVGHLGHISLSLSKQFGGLVKPFNADEFTCGSAGNCG